MRIALVIFHSDPGRGGAERYTADLARALVRAGHEVTLLASSIPLSPIVQRQIELDTPGATRAAKYRGFLNSLDEHLAANRYDIVHAMLPVRSCDIYHPHAGLAAEAVKDGHRKHRGAVVRAVSRLANGINPKRRAFAAVERKLVLGPGRPVVISLSRYVQQSIRAHFELREEQLATLFNAVDLAHYDPQRDRPLCVSRRAGLGLADGQTLALIISQDFRRKGLDTTLRALAELNDPRLSLLVVGRENPSHYRAMAKKLGVAGQVHFAGPTIDTYDEYGAADFFVLPTRHDPCSLVVLEALAMGLPVISTKFNGACEVMADGRHGRVLEDAGDVAGLAAAMRELMDGRHRRQMAAECLALRPMLSYEHHLKQLLAIYERRLAGRR